MLTYRDIINAFTKKISKAFLNVDIYTDDTVNGVDSACFYVQLVPGQSITSTRSTNLNNIMISVKYYGNKETEKLDLLDISNRLHNEFSRSVKVKEKFLHISNVETEVLKDEVGYYLDFLVSISYSSNIYIEKEDFEQIQEINISKIIQ